MNDTKVKEIVQILLNTQSLAVLSTLMSGRPYCNLIAFAATSDLRDIFFATIRETRKFANLTAEPRVSLLIDNRSNKETDFREASAVTVMGAAEEVLGSDRERYLRIFLEKHSDLEEFAKAPACALIRIKVEKYILVSHFQEVREIFPAA